MTRTMARLLVGWNFLNMIGVVGVLIWVSHQAGEGAKARETQCQAFPITEKLHVAAYLNGVISAEELETYRRASPRGCR